MSTKLTVTKLRDELQKRGLDTAGLKPALVSRLDAAVAEEEAELLTSNPAQQVNDGEKGEKRKRSSGLSLNEDNKSGKRVKLEDVSQSNAEVLKQALSKRGLSTSGRKDELVERLTEALEAEENASKDDEVVTADSKVNEEEEEEEKNVKHKVNEVSLLNVKELKEALSSRGLSTSGKKKDMVERLVEAVGAEDAIPVDKKALLDGKTDKDGKVVVGLKKGHAVLDQYLPDNIKQSCHVYETRQSKRDAEIFDAMLNQTNVGHNNNKFYVLQVLEADSGKTYYFYNRWGRVGVKGQNKLFGPYSTAAEATSEFVTKFYEKTKNQWDNRHNFVADPSKYTWIEMDYDAKDGDQAPEEKNVVKAKATKPVANTQSKLDYRVKQFIDLICDVDMMTQMMTEIGYDARKMPLGKLSKSSIMKGYEVLKRLATVVNDTTTSAKKREILQQLSSEFYTVIPHDFGFKHMQYFIIDTPLKLKMKLEMVEALGEIEVATKLLSHDGEKDDDMSYVNYKHLKCEIKPLDTTSGEYDLIGQYVEKTHAKTHHGYKLELLNVFKVQRDGESERFQPFEEVPNRMLLWHGSRLTNWTGILSQGLRIAPPEAPVTGYMFGKGVYFADMVSKSANYCCTSTSAPIGVLLLSEVALGDMRELCNADNDADKLPSGKLSTKGVGQTIPDPKEYRTLEDGVIVPLGTPIETNNTKARLMYNEYIVYNPAQICMRYLLQVRFHYKR